MQVEITNGDILVDAALLAKMLTIECAEIPGLMQTRAITSVCEKGVDSHQGQFWLSFFYGNRRRDWRTPQ